MIPALILLSLAVLFLTAALLASCVANIRQCQELVAAHTTIAEMTRPVRGTGLRMIVGGRAA